MQKTTKTAEVKELEAKLAKLEKQNAKLQKQVKDKTNALRRSHRKVEKLEAQTKQTPVEVISPIDDPELKKKYASMLASEIRMSPGQLERVLEIGVPVTTMKKK